MLNLRVLMDVFFAMLFFVFLEVDRCSLLFSIPLEVSPQFGKKPTDGNSIMKVDHP